MFGLGIIDILKWFLNPKVLIGLALAALAGYGWYEWNKVTTALVVAEKNLKQSEDNAIVLHSNNDIITKANQDAQKIVDTIAADRDAAVQAVDEVHQHMQNTTNDLTMAKNEISRLVDKSKDPPVSEYIREAVRRIQVQRGQEEVPKQ